MRVARRAAGAPTRRDDVAHSLDERIAARTLAPSERAVAKFFAERRDEVLFMSAGEIGSVVGTGGATVVRTAQRLGYTGLPELKRELREWLRQRTTQSRRLVRSLDDLRRGESVLDHVLSFQVATLTDARRTVRAADFDRAVRLLANAKRIVVYAPRPHEGLAGYFTRVLRRVGKHVLLVQSAGDAEELVELQAGDVLVMVAYQVLYKRLEDVLALARRRRVPAILVTDTLGLALKGKYAVALSARRGSALEFPTAVGIVAIFEALLIGVSSRHRARVIADTERITAIRRRLDETTNA